MTDRRDDEELARDLGRAITPPVPPVAPERVDAVRVEAQAATVTELTPRIASRRSLLRLGVAAAGGVAAGAAGVFLFDDDPVVPAGPPTETAAVVAADGITATAEMIDHTWGLEVLLDVDGLEPGAGYEMVFVAADDRRVGAGGFVGTGLPMRCRNNGALLRADATRFVVTGPDGTEVLSADLT